MTKRRTTELQPMSKKAFSTLFNFVLLFGAIIMSCTQRQKGRQQMASLLAKRNPIRKDSIGVISMISISPRTILTPCERAAVGEWGWQVAHGAHD